MEEIRINLSRIVATMTAIALEPYQLFVERLHAEGRVTDAEILELDRSLQERGDRLGELVQKKLEEEPLTAEDLMP